MAMLGLHPNGAASKAKSSHLNVTFGPEQPDYSQIPMAAGGAWGWKTTLPDEVEGAIKDSLKVVLEEKCCAVNDIVIENM